MNYQNLAAWQKGMDIVNEVYLISKSFPKEELFGLTSQAGRAAVSIPTNIAEGIGRNYKKETIQFLHVARGSAYELETLLKITINIGLINAENIEPILRMIDEEKRIINGLIKSYEERADLK